MTDQSTLSSPFAGISDDVFGEGYDRTPVEDVEVEDEAEEPEVEATADDTEEQYDEPETTEDDDESEVEAEAESEDDDEDAEVEEEGEEDEPEPARTIKFKWYGDEQEFDPFEDEAETARLIQMGKKFEKQHGVSDLIDKGIVKYDLEEGGLVPGSAFEQAKVQGARTIADHLTKFGILVQGANGQPEIAPAVMRALSQAAEPDTQADDNLTALEKRWHEEQSAEAWEAWQTAKIEREVERRLQTRDQATAKEREQQTQAETLRKRIELAKSNIATKANELKGLYKNPDGSFDEESWQYDLETAQALMLSRDDAGNYQYDRAMKGLERAAQLHAKRTTKTVTATTNRRKPAKKAERKPTSRPARGTAKKGKREVEIDPSNPFGHIQNPEL